MRELLVNFTRVRCTALAYEVEQELRRLLLTTWPWRCMRVRARVHQRLQRPRNVTVVDEEVLFDIKSLVAAFKIAGMIIIDPVAQDQILRACRGTNRIRLHK